MTGVDAVGDDSAALPLPFPLFLFYDDVALSVDGKAGCLSPVTSVGDVFSSENGWSNC